MTATAAETRTRFEVLERRSNVLDRCKTQTDRKMHEMKENIVTLRRELDVLDGKMTTLVSRATGSSPLSVQERVKRLEDSVKAVEVGRLEIGTHALSGSNDWLMDRIYALERTVDDLQVDLRDNLPDGLNTQFCKDLCSSTIQDLCRLEHKFDSVVLDADMETRIHLLESRSNVNFAEAPLISVSRLRAKANNLEEEIRVLRGDMDIALVGASDGAQARRMIGELEGWRLDKAEMIESIIALRAEARERDEKIRALHARLENLADTKEETRKRKLIANKK